MRSTNGEQQQQQSQQQAQQSEPLSVTPLTADQLTTPAGPNPVDLMPQLVIADAAAEGNVGALNALQTAPGATAPSSSPIDHALGSGDVSGVQIGSANDGTPVYDFGIFGGNGNGADGAQLHPFFPTLSPNGLGSVFRDTGRGLYNAVIDTAELIPNLLTFSTPGDRDYYPFLQGARLQYESPGFGGAVELVGGLGVFKAIGALGAVEGTATSTVVQVETRSAAAVNEAMVAAGNQPAWLANSDVVTQIVPKGTQYQMVMSEGQAQAVMEGRAWFGGWATPDSVSSQAFARNNLSILPEFKPDVSYVATVETTAPQMVNSGFAGPLGTYAGTGAQVEFVGGKSLVLVGSPRLLPPE